MQTTIQVEDSDFERLKQLKRQTGIPVTRLVRVFIIEGLKQAEGDLTGLVTKLISAESEAARKKAGIL